MQNSSSKIDIFKNSNSILIRLQAKVVKLDLSLTQ